MVLPSTVTLHIILLGVGDTIYNTHTLKPFKELGLGSQRVKKLASKLHVHSVNVAAKVRLHHYICLKGHLSGSLEIS